MSLSNHAVVIRPFQPGDQSAARNLILQGLAGHFGSIDYTLNPDLNDLARSYTTAGAIFLVAILGDDLVGTGALIMEGPRTGRLVRMSVSHAHRRQGIGRMLVEQLARLAHQRGDVRLVLETNLDWYDAQGLYLRCGFMEYNRDEESVHMELALSSKS